MIYNIIDIENTKQNIRLRNKMVKDYLEGVTEMPGAYVKVLAKEKNPLSALYEVYSDSESLGFATWEEIEEILEVMVQEEAGFAA